MRLRESIPFPLETLGDSHADWPRMCGEETEGKGGEEEGLLNTLLRSKEKGVQCEDSGFPAGAPA